MQYGPYDVKTKVLTTLLKLSQFLHYCHMFFTKTNNFNSPTAQHYFSKISQRAAGLLVYIYQHRTYCVTFYILKLVPRKHTASEHALLKRACTALTAHFQSAVALLLKRTSITGHRILKLNLSCSTSAESESVNTRAIGLERNARHLPRKMLTLVNNRP